MIQVSGNIYEGEYEVSFIYFTYFNKLFFQKIKIIEVK